MFNRDLDFLFLADGELSFIFSSLKEILDKKGMRTEKSDISIRKFIAIQEMPKLFIVDAETLLANAESRVLVYDKCIELNRKVVVIGDNQSLASLYDVTATNVIAQSFRRPVNNGEIAEKLVQIIQEIDEKGTKANILVVDDSPAFLRLASEWLENDYNVNVCPSATAAFHLIETNRPDLILLDYEMPICNGAQFLQMLRSEKITADIPVMFLTSKDDSETVKALIALKPQGYLLKNQTKENTLQAIANFFVREQMK